MHPFSSTCWGSPKGCTTPPKLKPGLRIWPSTPVRAHEINMNDCQNKIVLYNSHKHYRNLNAIFTMMGLWNGLGLGKSFLGKIEEPDEKPARLWRMGDAYERTMPHHQGIKQLWETKWKFPASHIHQMKATANKVSAQKVSTHSTTAKWQTSSPYFSN